MTSRLMDRPGLWEVRSTLRAAQRAVSRSGGAQWSVAVSRERCGRAVCIHATPGDLRLEVYLGDGDNAGLQGPEVMTDREALRVLDRLIQALGPKWPLEIKAEAQPRDQGENRPKNTDEAAPQGGQPSEDATMHGGDGNSGEVSHEAETEAADSRSAPEIGPEPSPAMGAGQDRQTGDEGPNDSLEDPGTGLANAERGHGGRGRPSSRPDSLPSRGERAEGPQGSDCDRSREQHQTMDTAKPSELDASSDDRTPDGDGPARGETSDDAEGKCEPDTESGSEDLAGSLAEGGVDDVDPIEADDGSDRQESELADPGDPDVVDATRAESVTECPDDAVRQDSAGSVYTSPGGPSFMDARRMQSYRNRIDKGLMRRIGKALHRLFDGWAMAAQGEMSSPRLNSRKLVTELVGRSYRLSRCRREEMVRPVVFVLPDVSGSCSASCDEAVAAALSLMDGRPGYDVAVVPHVNGSAIPLAASTPELMALMAQCLVRGSVDSWLDRWDEWRNWERLLARTGPVAGCLALGDADGTSLYRFLAKKAPLVWMDSYAAKGGARPVSQRSQLWMEVMSSGAWKGAPEPVIWWQGVNSPSRILEALNGHRSSSGGR